MKYFFYGFGSVLFVCLLLGGMLYALDHALGAMFLGDSKSDVEVLQESPSSDGRYIATAFVDMGGGAPGWCDVAVNVRAAGTELQPKESVFAGDCGTKIDLSWISAAEMTVAFSPDESDFGVSQASTNADGQVRIHYIERAVSPKKTN
jgi:hypothetical protein